MSFRALLPGIYVVIASLIWATDATVRDSSFTAAEARTVAFIEHLLAFVVVGPMFFQSIHKRVLPDRRREWGLFLLLGVGGSALAGILFTLAVQRLGASLAAVFIFLQPLAVLGLAYVFLKERSSPAFYFTALWVVANSVLMSFPAYQLGLPDERGSMLLAGSVFAVLATLIWAGTTVAGKVLLKTFSPVVVLVWRFGFAAGFLFVSLALVPEPVDFQAVLSEKGMLAALYLGVVVNAIAYLIYYQGLKSLPVRVVTFIELLYPIFGIFIPIWTSGAPVPVLSVIGSVTLIGAIVILLSMEYPRKIGDFAQSQDRS